MSSTSKRLTVSDYLARPEESGVQLIDGGLVMEPPPSLMHQDVVRNLAFIVNAHVRAKGLGKVYFAPVGVYLSDFDALEPDIMFVSKKNLGILKPDGAHGGPDLVIEVLSPSTARIDATTKRRIYHRHGVRELWLVDPLIRNIQRFDFQRDSRKPVQVIREPGTFTSPLLPELSLSTEEVFRN